MWECILKVAQFLGNNRLPWLVDGIVINYWAIVDFHGRLATTSFLSMLHAP